MLDLNAVDLNLLPKFRALYRRRSVSAAARDLHLTQSALSNALAKMRRLFDDELFLRTLDGMEPTPLAHDLAGPIERALARLETGLADAGPFRPARSGRTFRVALTQLAEAWLAPHVLALASAEAPEIVLSTVKSRNRLFEDDLRDGIIDVAVGHLPDLGPPFRDRILSEHEFVGILRRDHPALREPLTERALLACSFVEVVEHGAIYDGISRAMMRAAGRDRPHYRTANALALPYAVATTDLVAIVPAWFAARNAAAFDLRLVRLPGGASGTIRLFWHDGERDDAGRDWLHGAIARAAETADAAASGPPGAGEPAVMTPITDDDAAGASDRRPLASGVP